MKSSLKNEFELKTMAEGGEKLSLILKRTLKRIKPGLTTGQIDEWMDKEIIAAGASPSFKRVAGYTYASCVGINQEVVHSLPSFDKVIKKGDLLKIDIGLCYQGLNTDLAYTIEVESNQKRDFLQAGKEALDEAIKAAWSGNRVGDISLKIQEFIKKAGYAPVKVLTGHAIGKKLHEDPLIPCFLNGKVEDTPKLEVGMTLALEVIYNLGSDEVVLEDDGWTISTKDGKISGLFEKTIAVTRLGPLILTPVAF